MTVSSNHGREFPTLNGLSPDEIEQLIQAELFWEEGADIARLEHLVAALDAAGTVPPVDVKKAREAFSLAYLKQTQEPPASEEQFSSAHTGPGKKKAGVRPRRALIAAVAAVTILCAMTVVQATGIDVFGAIGRWTDETFHFVTSSAGRVQGSPEPASTSESHTLLQAVLVECGIAESLAPTWYPEGFETAELETFHHDIGSKVFCSFRNRGEGIFMFQVSRYDSADYMGSYTFEKDDSPVIEYTSHGRTFYIFSNLGNTTATWSDGSALLISISGNIPEDDIKAIIDSIGGT